MTATTDAALQIFVDILEFFKDVPYPGYRRKQAKNKPTEAYYFLVKQNSKLLQIKKHVLLHTQIVKSEVVGTKHVNKTLEPVTKDVNETTQYGITSTNE